MKDCDVIQPELSAYVDGELTPPQRKLVEAHLASCPRCQQALAELKTVAAGMAALPKLQPAPQFLAQVRGKISRGDDPEALTWFDHLFRPFLLKVPMEVAALVAIALLVIQFRQPPPAETVGSDQVAQGENSVNQQSLPMETRTEAVRSAPPESASVAQPLPATPAPENEMAAAPAGESMPSPEAQATTESTAGPSENNAPQSVSGNGQSVGLQAKSATVAGGRNIKFTSGTKRRVTAGNRGTNGPAITGAPSGTEVSTLARNAGIDPSKVGGVVVVQSRNLRDVQGRAEELAAQCNGKVISVSPSMESTGQIFFVEVPREYAASFKLDLQQNAAPSVLSTNRVVAGVAAFTTNAGLLSATSTARVIGVLTGGINTNAVFNGPAQLSLANNPQARAAATTVLEILVVPPPSLAPTNSTPTATTATPAH
jgi:anti-sigma factor RsiW